MTKRTPLNDAHRQAGAKMVDFGGWEMPLHYGSQVEEHHQVRRHCGLFDVSHMTVVDVTGADGGDYLRYLLANDIARLDEPGKALYTVMLTEQGGVIDDLIVYFVEEGQYRLVVNSGTRDKVLAWMRRHLEGRDVSLTERTDLAIIAVQGPAAMDTVNAVACDDAVAAIDTLKPFRAASVGNWFISRTGYTGEDGLEIILPGDSARDLWQRLLDAGAVPAGLGARDTLRLEAGLNLYGNDMDETVSPLEANLGWTIAWQPEDRDFIGRQALAAQKAAGVERKLVGLVLEGRGIPRSHQRVRAEGLQGGGEVTSGTFSPTLGKGIALARVPVDIGDSCSVEMRSRQVPARVVKPCFVRNGVQVFDETSGREQ